MNLRWRFIISNVLPIFIILPLIGLLLIFALERFVFVPQFSAQILADLNLLSQVARDTPDVFEDSIQGQEFIDQYASGTPWRLMVLDADGVIIASSNPVGNTQIGEGIDGQQFKQVLAGDNFVETDYSAGLDSESIEAWGSVRDDSGNLIGVLGISHPLENLGQELKQLRSVVAIILVTGLILGGLIGLRLAVSMERPINQMTDALRSMAWETSPSSIEIEGPEEFHLLTAAFNHLVNRIEELETTRKHLLANLVHELGRPLGAFRSSIQALAHGADQDLELRNDLLNGMDSQTRDLSRLVDDLTHLYDSSAGRFELKRQPVKVDDWLKEITTPWKTYAKESGIDFRIEIVDLPRLWIDPSRLSQAVGNLLSNAIKFTPEGGKVLVSTGVEVDFITIKISDSGPGLSEEDKAQLFTPFYRGHQTSRFPQGMGLGLTIARDIILSHRGTLEADSLPRQGTCFTIRLPLSEQRSNETID